MDESTPTDQPQAAVVLVQASCPKCTKAAGSVEQCVDGFGTGIVMFGNSIFYGIGFGLGICLGLSIVGAIISAKVHTGPA